MKLYKYISLAEPYWADILTKNNLHFSPIEQLRNRNDVDEFNHTWDTTSFFFSRYGDTLIDTYNRIFTNAGIFCVAKSLSKECKNALLPKAPNVICYEFEFDRDQNSEISSNDVDYAIEKINNVPCFLDMNIRDQELRRLLAQTENLTMAETAKIIEGINVGMDKLFCEHIWKELTLKKVGKFSLEDEYRFIHIKKPVGPIQPAKLIDEQNKMQAVDVGLKLICIHTNKVDAVAQHPESSNYAVEYFEF